MLIRLSGFLGFVFLWIFAVGAGAQSLGIQPNTLGLYFDEEGTTVCADYPGEVLTLYAVLTNPTFEAVGGFEWGLTVSGEGADDFYCLALRLWNCKGRCLPPSATLFNVIYSLGVEHPVEYTTVLCEYDILMLNDEPLEFILHGSTPSSLPGDLPVVMAEHSLLQLNISVAPGEPCLQINGECSVVSVEQQSWDQIKALYAGSH